MEIVNQLGGLMLGSVPTIVFFVLLVIAYGILVGGPLKKTLAERHARTAGAVEQARGAISAAEAETAAYEQKLRAARLEIQTAREQRLKQWNVEREAAVAGARAAAQERVAAAKSEIGEAAVVARKQIEDATGMLSEQILKAVLPGGTKLSEARQ